MNETLKKYLSSLNCTVINPIKKSLGDETIVGWFCKSPNILRKNKHMELIENFIQTNQINYTLTEYNDSKAEFFIYINRDVK